MTKFLVLTFSLSLLLSTSVFANETEDRVAEFDLGIKQKLAQLFDKEESESGKACQFRPLLMGEAFGTRYLNLMVTRGSRRYRCEPIENTKNTKKMTLVCDSLLYDGVEPCRSKLVPIYKYAGPAATVQYVQSAGQGELEIKVFLTDGNSKELNCELNQELNQTKELPYSDLSCN